MSPAAAVEVVARAERRRWSSEKKLRIVRETLEPGASVGTVARRNGVAANLLYTWRRRVLAGALAGLVPVEVTDPLRSRDGAASGMPAAAGHGAGIDAVARTGTHAGCSVIEIVLVNGSRVRVGTGAEGDMVRLVLDALGAAR